MLFALNWLYFISVIPFISELLDRKFLKKIRPYFFHANWS